MDRTMRRQDDGGAGGGRPRRKRESGVKSINVALQGGGAHGAFSWGVLDRLLADPRIEIEAIAGTSAGAMNAVVVADGLANGCPQTARARLERFWKAVSFGALMSPIQRSAIDMALSNWSLDHNPALLLADMMTRIASPYQLNPLNINPLRDLLVQHVDFANVRTCDSPKLFISATNVQTGRARVFTGAEVTADAVMASACLPYLFQAVEIDGVPYWDGGYKGNPVLYPFLKTCSSPDVVLVQIVPIARAETPRTAREIMDRVNEISFNAPLIKDLRHIEFVNECLDRGELAGLGYRKILLHAITGGSEFAKLTASSKLNAEWLFLTHLRDMGHAAADAWLEAHHADIGRRATMDMSVFRYEGDVRVGASGVE
jgi:NTE family protein